MVVVAPGSAPVPCPMQRTSAFRAANAARSSSSIGACNHARCSPLPSRNTMGRIYLVRLFKPCETPHPRPVRGLLFFCSQAAKRCARAVLRSLT